MNDSISRNLPVELKILVSAQGENAIMRRIAEMDLCKRIHIVVGGEIFSSPKIDCLSGKIKMVWTGQWTT